MVPRLIIHGGAGKRPRDKTRIEKIRKAIKEVLKRSRPVLEERGALAARIATRDVDGMKLQRAMEKSFKELEGAGGKAGIVAVTKKGDLFYFYNTEFMSYGFLEGDRLIIGK